MAQPASFRLEDIDLAEFDFWARPLDEREAAFDTLRRLGRPRFFREVDMTHMGFPPGPGYHALVNHADIVEASRQPEIFRSTPSSTTIPDMPPEFGEFFGSMINMDDPRHARLRRIVARAFTPRRIQRFEDDVDAVAATVVGELVGRGSPCDFVTEVAVRVPLKIICDMMGIPERDYQFVFDQSNVILGGFDSEYVANESEMGTAVLTAGQQLSDLVQELSRDRIDNPTDDLISALAGANVDGERLTRAEIGSFFILLVVAGNETTRNAISHGLRLLTENPGQRDLWATDFERYAPTAVEEIVRLASPVVWMRRTLTRDHELHGHRYAGGDKVLLFYWSANRDEAVFTHPYTFDITRDPNPHVGFGGPGPHFCLGAHLARREVTATFRELFRTVPGIRMAGEPQRLLSPFINGIKHMTCEW